VQPERITESGRTTMHLTDDELVLHYYGEMTDAAEARACAHLDTCVDCRQQLVKLQRVMAAIDSAPLAEPGAWFEQKTWQRLQPALDVQRRRAWISGWMPSHAAMASVRLAAVAAMLLVAAFVAGRLWTSRPIPQPAATTATAPANEQVRERVLLVDLGDHLDRSELALVEFVAGGDVRELTGERARAEDLVAANRLYRDTALASGDRAVADVLEELERVLIEIAGTSPSMSTSDLDAVRRRIDARDLLFKMRVMRSGLRDRVKGSEQVKDQNTL
jgi:hypothetical protein